MSQPRNVLWPRSQNSILLSETWRWTVSGLDFSEYGFGRIFLRTPRGSEHR